MAKSSDIKYLTAIKQEKPKKKFCPLRNMVLNTLITKTLNF